MSHPWKRYSYKRMVACSRLEDYKERRARSDKFSRPDPLGGQGDPSPQEDGPALVKADISKCAVHDQKFLLLIIRSIYYTF